MVTWPGFSFGKDDLIIAKNMLTKITSGATLPAKRQHYFKHFESVIK